MSDINGGAGYPNANGSPIFPGTTFTGPLIAGNIPHSDGSGTLAALGGTGGGTANAGYVVMAQTQVVTQAASAGNAAGVFTTTIVIPAQSKIDAIKMMVTTAWTGGGTTFEIGSTAGTTAATAFSAAGIAGGTAGLVTVSPTTTAQIANWDNTSNATFQAGGPVDVQIQITSANTGSGVGTLTVTYIQGCNLAS
jgi:hypothetical protein